MKKIEHFVDLRIWKESIKLCSEVYKLTASFPSSEKYGILSQLQRASASVGANIAEGFGRYYFKDKVRFFYNARGSLYETQNFLLLCVELNYLEKIEVDYFITQYNLLSKSIHAFINSIQKEYLDVK